MERLSVSSLAALEHDAPDADVIVNATPLGMKEGDPLPLPPEYVQRGRAICDVVYRPGKETPLVRLAKERGAPATSRAAACCSTRVCWRRSSGPGGIPTWRRWTALSLEGGHPRHQLNRQGKIVDSTFRTRAHAEPFSSVIPAKLVPRESG